MKKVLLASLASVALFAADHNLYNHSLFVVGGVAINSTESRLDNDITWGLRYNYNRNTPENSIDIDAVQIAFDYSNGTVYQSSTVADGEVSIMRFGANALWYIENDSDFTPFVLLGAGVQHFDEEGAEENNEMLFGTVGGGVEYQVQGDFSVVGEGKMMISDSDSRYFSTTVGLKYSFGQNY